MPKCSIAPPNAVSGDVQRDLQNLNEWGTALSRELSFLFGSLESEFEPKAKKERRVTNDDTTEPEELAEQESGV